MPSWPPPRRAVRLLIADDQRLFSESLRTVLTQDENVEVVGIADNGAQAVELAEALRPDVILMDLRMPVMDGLEATRQIRQAGNDAQILILTGTESVGSEDAAAAGASAFLRKEQSLEELRQVFFGVASLAAALGGSRN